ncbi:MAG: hypothetical protein ACI867_000389 [Glaciecola sp.]|jgi:hypothetical protein
MTYRHKSRALAVRESSRAVPQIYAEMADVALLAALIPSVRRCFEVQDRWRWEMKTYRALGLSVTPEFDVDAVFSNEQGVRFRPVGEVTEGARGEGEIGLTAGRIGADFLTEIRIEMTVTVDLQLPRMLGSAVGRIVTREVRQVIDDLADRLASGT